MMTAVRSIESTNWVPEFEFEVWSLGIDCKKHHANYCWQLAQAVDDDEESRYLKAMAQKQWAENKSLSSHINNIIDNLLGDFYTNGGQALQGSLPVSTRKQIRDLLNEIEHYEATDTNSNNEPDGSALAYAKEQAAFYRKMFSQLSDLYPEGAVKRAFKQLAF